MRIAGSSVSVSFIYGGTCDVAGAALCQAPGSGAGISTVLLEEVHKTATVTKSETATVVKTRTRGVATVTGGVPGRAPRAAKHGGRDGDEAQKLFDFCSSGNITLGLFTVQGGLKSDDYCFFNQDRSLYHFDPADLDDLRDASRACGYGKGWIRSIKGLDAGKCNYVDVDNETGVVTVGVGMDEEACSDAQGNGRAVWCVDPAVPKPSLFGERKEPCTRTVTVKPVETTTYTVTSVVNTRVIVRTVPSRTVTVSH
jgi:hypothetical protein